MEQKNKKLFETALLVAMVIILGKCFGFLRELVVAFYYGANEQTDVFFFAQGMPGMIFPSVCNGISTVFLPVFLEKEHRFGACESRRYGTRMFLVAESFSVLLELIAIFTMPLIVRLMAHGFSQEQYELALDLSRLIMMTFPIIMSQYMLMAMLNAKKHFFPHHIATVINSIVIIALIVFTDMKHSLIGLTWAVILGHFFQAGILLGYEEKYIGFEFNWDSVIKDVKHLIKLVVPVLIGNSLIQANTIVDKALASSVSDGGISALSYSMSLNNLALEVIIFSMTTVILPELTNNSLEGKDKEYGDLIKKGIFTMTLILLPVSILIFIFSQNIVEIVFMRGAFNSKAVGLTSMVFQCYSGMFIFYACREILTKAFYAVQDMRSPMVTGAVGVLANIIISICGAKFWGLRAIAVGTVVSAMISSILLIRIAERKLPNMKNIWNQEYVYVIFAGIIMMLMGMYLKEKIIMFPKIINLGINCLICLVVYAGTLLLLFRKYLIKCFKN